MRLQNWIWLYLGMGGSFTRWAALLFYGALWAAVLVVAGFLCVLAMAMILHSGA
ncbi:hypothetical protein [Bryobacter aggregatus]|uniref:hypothetical protein n=1 Tax=Bryobacter aggregatus TaxID=360054 RepID=UPI0012BAE245|nr:hypothetical protein [Bryobacter aggregatus]